MQKMTISESGLVQIGDVVFNVHDVILATRETNGHVVVNLDSFNEHVFSGPDAILAWTTITAHCCVRKRPLDTEDALIQLLEPGNQNGNDYQREQVERKN